MSSNHLKQGLFGSRWCVAKVRMGVFNAFVSTTEVFVIRVKCVHLLLENWFRTPLKKFSKILFQVEMVLKKVQKQGRDEGMQEDYPTSTVYFLQM